MENKIIYFGYGANSSDEMIGALIGRKPKGFKASLKNYSLHLQNWQEIPREAKQILSKSWTPSFKSYIAVPDQNEIILGTAWYLTKEEREAIGFWEMHNLWYTPVFVEIEDEKGKKMIAETEIIKFTNCEKVTKKNYEVFPNSKEEMLSLAREVREEFLNNKK